MMSNSSTTPASPSSTSSSRPRTPLSIDLSSLPPLQAPTPPSNTLLITNLLDPEIFLPSNLQTIRDLINTSAPIHTFAPLKSFRRILVSFYSIESAIRIRQLLDGETIMGLRVRVYFGSQTKIEVKDEHLNLPDAGKLFFISPPPSPPCGWESKLEGEPNKEVHADDLAEALKKLHHRGAPSGTEFPASPVSDGEDGSGNARPSKSEGVRNRSGSTTIFDPNQHGGSPGLPAIAVQDLTEEGEESEISPIGGEKPLLAHTSRPPVELMQ